METILSGLLDLWLQDASGQGDDVVRVVDTASLTLVRERVREVGAGRLAPETLAALSIAATELAQNQLSHAGGGYFLARDIVRDGVAGVELIAADTGNGIREPTSALQGNVRSPAGLGAGLSAVQRLTDELDLDIRVSEGSCVWARKFAAPVRRRRQVAIFGRHHPHEVVSGDHATFRRLESTLTLAMADGLGHGPEARAAANVAISGPARRPTLTPEQQLQQQHAQLVGTRGAVMAAASLHEEDATYEAANVGNICLSLLGPGVNKRLGGTSFTLGGHGTVRIRPETGALRSWDAFVMFTDGLSSRAQPSNLDDLLLDHPIALAEALLQGFAVQHDDALVLVAR